ncbi:MAG: hypothetical protein RL215_1674 [Planctomycetota bacterium]
MRASSISGGTAGVLAGAGEVAGAAVAGLGRAGVGAAAVGFLATTLALAGVLVAAGAGRVLADGAGAFREIFFTGAFAATFFDIGQPSLRSWQQNAVSDQASTVGEPQNGRQETRPGSRLAASSAMHPGPN